MINIHCFTNLDVHEDWPSELCTRPVIGDYIESKIKRRNGFQLRLKVCSCVFRSDGILGVQLHLGTCETVSEFTERYGRLTS